MLSRFERLALTFIAKKYVAWLVAIWLLLQGKITGSDWCLLTAGIFAIDAYSKTRIPAPVSRPLAGIEAQVDRWLEDDVVDIDAARTGGLLELTLPDRSKLVINTQPPLHELWLAARRGGYHFKCVGGRWLDTREGQEFFALLSACASEQAGRPLSFTAP